MIFENRVAAARQLAAALSEYRNKHPLVLAIPRGAVPMAKVIADELNGELDVVLVHKVGAPGNPEFAIGAVDESGWVYLADYADETGASEQYIRNEVSTQLAAIRQRRAQYTPIRQPIDPAGRVVIVTDDGLATGSTMLAALHALRAKNPSGTDLRRAGGAARHAGKSAKQRGSCSLSLDTYQLSGGRAVLHGVPASDGRRGYRHAFRHFWLSPG